MPSPTQIRGQRHEDLAEEILTREGYRVVERNWRGGRGEIDRIAIEGDVLVFVEIRSRATSEHGVPAETVRPKKQSRIVSAAIAYLAALPPPHPDVRFDVVSVLEREDGPPEVEIIRGAFDASSAYRGRTIPWV